MRPGRGNCRGKPWGVLSVGLLAAAVWAAAAGGAEVGVETLRVGFPSNDRPNLFKIGAWTPVWVQLGGGSERFQGTMEVEVPDDQGTPTTFRQAVDVPAGGNARFVTYARPGSRDPNFVIRLFDPSGRRVGSPVDGSALAQLSPVQPDETLLLALGRPQGVEQVPKLPGFNAEDDAGGSPELTVARPDAAGAGLPGRWYGYDAADAVVVDTNDKDLMRVLEVRGQALVDWVARGGHLVVAVGSNWQAVRDSALGPILPAVPVGQDRLTSIDLKTLDTFAGANKSIVSLDAPAAQVARLRRVDERGGKVLSAAGDVALVVRGPHGFGRVTLVGLDVDGKPFSDWPDRALFWVKALDLRRQPRDPNAAAVRLGGGGRRLTQSGVTDLSGVLREAMEQFPGVRLVPFGWVAFLIFLYILLIGPGDYFFLKKVVKRMELTWVTFPLIVLTVSLLAYAAAYTAKGKDLRVNKLDVVDVDQGAGQSRGSTFVNLFSPQNRDYDVSVVPLPLDRPSPSDAAGGSPAASTSAATAGRPPAGTEVMMTWQGVPEPGFGGMGGSARIGFSGGGYTSMPPGGSETLQGLRVPIWSTKLLTARWFGPAPALIEADLLPVGTDRLSGTVASRLDQPMEDVILAFGKHVYLLGKVAAGQTVRVELAPDRQLSGLLSDRCRDGGVVSDHSSSTGRISRSALALALMFHDSQGKTTGDRPLASKPLHYLDLTGQLALDRPMLVGRLGRPASRLVLDRAPNPPKVDQTTILRVILPLGKPPAERP